MSRFKVAKVNFEGESQGDLESSQNTINYDTQNVKSLTQYTQEVIPRADHYRNILSLHGHVSRPTLDELHIGHETATFKGTTTNGDCKVESGENIAGNTHTKFGWVKGVLVRCLLNIWGVMLFLRLSWVVGQAGILYGCLVILLATVVTILTAISMSAICTNGEVKGGGTYYMISRSLGPEFGGSIGLIFALANAVAAAMYLVGFSETVINVLKDNGLQIVDGAQNDIRIVSCSAAVVLLGIVIIGTEWETKAQIVLLFILLAAMCNFVVGVFLSPSEFQISRGFIGFSQELFYENLWPDYRGENFFSVFAVFFPAATGILAGANISGDLKDPQKAIPKGTILAIGLTTLSYIGFAILVGSVMIRDATGILNSTDILVLTNCSITATGECKYGLINSYQVMELVSGWGPLIIAGVFAATLSSALASLVSAPKVFQALCRDKLFPYIEGFGKGYGKNDEPRRGYIITFIIAVLFCIIGDLNDIAPIISNFFLAAYCLINFSTFHASYAKSPGFRPAFKYYNKWLSLLGALLCLAVMFIMVWWTALVTFVLVAILYYYIYHRQPDVNWGSSNHAQTYKDALQSVMKLNQVPIHVKNYRPQVLVLTGDPSSRPALVDFTYSITKKNSLMICGHIIPMLSLKKRERLVEKAYNWLKYRKVKSFYNYIEVEDGFSNGVRALIQVAGIGKLQPNILLMGYKNDWQRCSIDELIEYNKVIHYTLDLHMSLGILRLPEGLDFSQYHDLEESEGHATVTKTDSEGLERTVSCSQLSEGTADSAISLSTLPSSKKDVISGFSKSIPKEILTSLNQFQNKQKKGTIDVWWLYDDGGLTMLIPYILSTRHQWGDCTLRIFTLANKKSELDSEQRSMASLLNKFRIDFSDVIVIPDIVKPPQASRVKEFNELIKQWRGENDSEKGHFISDTELNSFKNKTNRQIRLRELLLTHSREASLIIMTCPMPRKEMCSAPLFMAWLETLTKDMPPILLLRGNQTSVLTFYS